MLSSRHPMITVARLLMRRTMTTLHAPVEPVILRPYQESCLQACTDALAGGAARIGVSLPTGSGKTTVFVSLITRLTPPQNNPTARRALIIVNSIELAKQAAHQAKLLRPDLNVEIEQGVKHTASGKADITVATYQTLLRPARMAKFDPNQLKVVVVDEAHHAAAPSYRRILSHFDPNIRSPDVDFPQPSLSHAIPIVGFSATFSRHDGRALGSVFEKIVYHRDFLKMIQEQWLCNVRFTSVKAKLNLAGVTISSSTGDFNTISLSHVVNTELTNKLVVETWLDKASSRKSTLVFCASLSHLRALTDAFRQAGVDARYVYAGTPTAKRDALINGFRRGDFPVLLNVAILTEGADIPNIDCVVVARPTRSRNVFAQMIGRGMRLSPKTAKSDCHIIDFVDSSRTISGIVSTPTLFGLDPEDTVQDETPESLEARAASKFGENGLNYDSDLLPDPESVTYTDYDDPFALVNDCSGAPYVTKLSYFSWVNCGEGIYVLECLGKGHLRIQPTNKDEDNGPRFVAHFTPASISREEAMATRRSRFLRPRQILLANTLDEAVRGCDTYATTKVLFGNMITGLFRTAKWRNAPCSKNQKEFIAKRFGSKNASIDADADAADMKDGFGTASQKPFDIDRLTKGKAANIITRLKHGAQARFASKTRRLAKEAKVLQKERTRRAREVVEVGPLSITDDG